MVNHTSCTDKLLRLARFSAQGSILSVNVVFSLKHFVPPSRVLASRVWAVPDSQCQTMTVEMPRKVFLVARAFAATSLRALDRDSIFLGMCAIIFTVRNLSGQF